MVLRLGDAELDPERHELRRGGRRVPVEPKVLDLLLHLARRPGRLVTKRDLLRSVWSGVAVSDWAVARAVKEARRALGDSGRAPALLETVRGRGYRLLVSTGPGDPGAGEVDRDPLVGRRAPLAELEAELARCRLGRAALLLVTGPPGIGKTRLATTLAARGEAFGFEVHGGRCLRDPGAPSGWPWTQVLRSALETADALPLAAGDRAVLARALPDLAELLGVGAEATHRLADLGPSVERFRCFDRCARLLTRLADLRPRMIVLDDLHLADAFSLQMLTFLARSLGDAPVALLGTLRDADPEADPACTALLAELEGREDVHRVVLPGLDETAVTALWRARRSDPVRPNAVRALVASTGGNPLFLGQLLLLPDPGDLPAAARAEGVRGAVRRHLEALSPACRGLLAAAALVGTDFDLDTAIAASGLDRVTLRRHLDEALRSGVVAAVAGESTLFRFAHELVAEGLRDALPEAERARLHGRIAESLIALPAPLQPVGSIARHLASAAAHEEDASRALDWCARAAREAAERHAYEEARGHSERALAMAARVPALAIGRRLALEAAWLRSRLRCGDEEAAPLVEALAERARRHRVDTVLVEAALSRDEPGLQLGGDHLRDPLVIRLLEDALEVAPEDAAVVRVQLQARLARRLFYARRIDRARALAQEALRLATPLGDPLPELEAISASVAALWDPMHIEERRALARRAIELARGARAREWEYGARALLAVADVERGEIDEAADELRSLRRMAAALPWRPPGSDWIVEPAETLLLLMRGRLREAEAAIFERLRAPGAAGRRSDFEPLVGAQLTQLRICQGRAADVLPLVKPLPDRLGRGWLAVVAYVGAEAGLGDEARGALEALAVNGFRDVFESVNWPILLSAAADACVTLEAAEHAERLYALTAPLGDAHLVLRPLVVSYGSAARTRGGLAMLLGRWDAALGHLDVALRRHRAMGALAWELRTRADRARVLLRRGAADDLPEVRDLLAATRRSCAALGLGGVAHRVEALAAEAGERPERGRE